MQSMTGFGRGSAVCGPVSITCEVRSVNHRAMDLKFRLPRELMGAEADMAKAIKACAQRGRIEVFLNIERDGTTSREVVLDEALAGEIVAKAAAFQAAHGLSGALDMNAVVRLPGVLSARDTAVEPEVLEKGALEALSGALEQWKAARTREGAALADILRARLKACDDERTVIAELTDGSIAARQDALRTRVQALLDDTAVDETRLASELALIADRGDVSEELDRLTAHFEHFEALFATDGAIGRKMDFLCQELMRETNTIGSKCADADMAHRVVELKTCVERVREQVQNVE